MNLVFNRWNLIEFTECVCLEW